MLHTLDRLGRQRSFDFDGEAPLPLKMLRDQRGALTLEQQAGVGEGWCMPVALWSSSAGWGEEFFAAQTGAHSVTFAKSPVPMASVLKGHEYVAKGEPDHFSVFQQGEPIRCVGDRGARYVECYIEPQYLTALAEETSATSARSGALEQFILHRQDIELRLQLDAYVRRAFDQFDPANALEMNARSTIIGLHLLRNFGDGVARPMEPRARGGLTPTHLRRVCDFIDAHLGEPVSLQTLASLCGLSTPHFCTAFARSAGMPPHRWLTHRRIERAKTLLRTTPLELTEIAQIVGFSGQGAFGAAFKRTTRSTPGAWRREFRARALTGS